MLGFQGDFLSRLLGFRCGLSGLLPGGLTDRFGLQTDRFGLQTGGLGFAGRLAFGNACIAREAGCEGANVGSGRARNCTRLEMVWVCGVDGYKSQWCVVLRNLDTDEFRSRVVPFRNLRNLLEKPSIICVDVPIGLPDVTPTGGRSCELQARRILGSARARSVFSAVGRVALKAGTRPEADRLSRARGGIGIGAQAWGLSKKLREVDAIMNPALQHLVREVHPELSFGEMVGRPPNHGKKSLSGERERAAALAATGFPESIIQTEAARLGVGRDDFLDACAALWTAERIFKGTAKRIPEVVERDSRGLDMAMWF